MRVMDEATGSLIGHFADISTGGFKVDSSRPVTVNASYRLRIDQMGGISNKSFITFMARARWCKVDPFDPNLYNIGFQITEMTPSDYDVYVKMVSSYSYTR
jgi:hypothetical protein